MWSQAKWGVCKGNKNIMFTLLDQIKLHFNCNILLLCGCIVEYNEIVNFVL